MTIFKRWTEAVKFLAKVHGDCSILIAVLGGVGIYQHRYEPGKPITRGSLLWPYKTTCYRVAKGGEMNPLLIVVVVVVGIGLICYIVPRRYPAPKLARFLSVEWRGFRHFQISLFAIPIEIQFDDF